MLYCLFAGTCAPSSFAAEERLGTVYGGVGTSPEVPPERDSRSAGPWGWLLQHSGVYSICTRVWLSGERRRAAWSLLQGELNRFRVIKFR